MTDTSNTFSLGLSLDDIKDETSNLQDELVTEEKEEARETQIFTGSGPVDTLSLLGCVTVT